MEQVVQKTVCDIQHENIEKNMEVLSRRQDKTEGRVGALEQVSAQRTTEVENICEAVSILSLKIDKILEQNNNMMKSILLVFIGFFMFVLEQIFTGHLIF